MCSLEFKSELCCSREKVWKGISTMKGVNKEFFPLLYMTSPDSNLQISSSLVGISPLFRSWLLLFGIFPIEFDLISFIQVKEEEKFEEKSSMLLIKEWNHKRDLYILSNDNQNNDSLNTLNNDQKNDLEMDQKINETENKTLIVDRLSFIPRIPGTGFILSFIIKSLFYYRHWRLRMIYKS